MNCKARSKAPRAMPYILLQSDEHPNEEPKKILLPKTIQDLKITAKKVLKIKNPRVIIYSTSNDVIRDISEIEPGMKIVISQILPNDEGKKPQSGKAKSPLTKRVNRIFGNDVKNIKIHQQTDLELSDESFSDEVISLEPIDKDKETGYIANEKQPAPKKSNLPIYHSTRTISHEAKENTSTEQNSKEPIHNDDNDDDDDYSEQNDEIPNYYYQEEKSGDEGNGNEEEEEEEEEEENSDPANPYFEIFEEALPGQEFNDDIRNIVNSLQPEYLDFFKNALILEREQKDRWASSLLKITQQEGFAFCPEKIDEFSSIQQKAVSILQNHFFASSGGLCTSNKTVIDGPPRSGKTTLLSILLNQFILTTATQNLWKKTFILAINCENISFYAADPKLLYLQYVRITIEHLVAQVPEAIPHSSMLQKYFEKIVDNSYLPMFPKKFSTSPLTSRLAAACSSVASLLSQSWNTSNGRECFCTLIFMMPILIAKNLGFSDVMLFVDHMDLLNVVIDEIDRFPESPDELYLIEHFKNSLAQTNFVVSFKDSEEISSCLPPLDESAIDLTHVVNFESTLDVESEVQYENLEFSFKIEEKNYKIRAQHFGGIPAYLTLWNELNILMDDVDDTEIDCEEYEDKYINVVNQIQSIIPIIFVNGKEYNNIVDVRRKEI